MSGSATNFLEYALLRHVLLIAPYPQPSAIWVGALTAHSTDGPGTEVAAPGYARTPSGLWTATSGDPSEGVNAVAIEFPFATVDWGSVTHAALYDAPSGGNELLWGQLVNPVDGVTPAPTVVGVGDSLRIPPGAFRVRMT